MKKPKQNQRSRVRRLQRSQIIDLTGCPYCLARIGKPCRDAIPAKNVAGPVPRDRVHVPRLRRAQELANPSLARRRAAAGGSAPRYPGDERDHVGYWDVPSPRRTPVKPETDEARQQTRENVRRARLMDL